MKNLVGVKFEHNDKLYMFNPDHLNLKVGDKIVVDTTQGEELVEVKILKKVTNDSIDSYAKVIRLATKEDIAKKEECFKVEKEAYNVFIKKIKEYKLKMVLENVEYKFDHSKLLFYFTAEERIDFRELVKDLAAIYKTRIELRQLGVREQLKKCGGYGICGRHLCCCSFLKECNQVTIKMAKEQNLSLNPYKISGCCGKLMCCIKYESDVYEEKLSKLPKIGTTVKTPDGIGVIDYIETLSEIIRVKIKDEEGYIYKKYKTSDLEVIEDETNSQN